MPFPIDLSRRLDFIRNGILYILYIPFILFKPSDPKTLMQSRLQEADTRHHSNAELGSGGTLDVFPVRRESFLNGTARTAILVHNLGTATSVQLSFEHAVKFTPNGLEKFVALNALHQVIGLALILHDGTGLVRQDTDLLVSLLTGLALRTEAHDNGLGDHEGQLSLDVSGDALGVDDEAVGDVVETNQDGVCEEHGLGNIHATDRGVIKCTLHCIASQFIVW